MSSRDRDPERYRQIKASVDYGFRKQQAIILIFLSILLSMFLIVGRQRIMPNTVIGMIVFGAISLGGVVNCHKLLRHIDCYFFFETVLDQPHTAMNYRSRSVYFTVTGTDPQGKQFQSNTEAIFSTAFGPAMEDYLNHRVLAAYNPRTSCLVIVKKLP